TTRCFMLEDRQSCLVEDRQSCLVEDRQSCLSGQARLPVLHIHTSFGKTAAPQCCCTKPSATPPSMATIRSTGRCGFAFATNRATASPTFSRARLPAHRAANRF